MQERKINDKSFLKDMLVAQKRTVKRIATDFLGAAILFLILAIVVLIIALTLDDKEHANRILYIVLPILSVISVAFLFVSVRWFLIVNELNRLNKDSDEKINVKCKKVRYIIHPLGRSSYNSIFGIVLVADNRQKYIYILPNMFIASKATRDDIRRRCEGKFVEILCYKGHGIIKYFDAFGVEEE